jgi:hypothetical protein
MAAKVTLPMRETLGRQQRVVLVDAEIISPFG